MKTLFTTAAAVLFSTAAFAGSPFDGNDTYGTVLFDLDQPAVSSEGFREPTGALATEIYSTDTFGSVLFDLERPTREHVLSAPPSIGDNADDYGSMLYDLGARY